MGARGLKVPFALIEISNQACAARFSVAPREPARNGAAERSAASGARAARGAGPATVSESSEHPAAMAATRSANAARCRLTLFGRIRILILSEGVKER